MGAMARRALGAPGRDAEKAGRAKKEIISSSSKRYEIESAVSKYDLKSRQFLTNNPAIARRMGMPPPAVIVCGPAYTAIKGDVRANGEVVRFVRGAKQWARALMRGIGRAGDRSDFNAGRAEAQR